MENINCKKCGAQTDNQIELVTLKTMVDRGWKKNKYYQAMGEIVHTAICDDCVNTYINQVMNPNKVIMRLILLTSLVVGGCVALFLWVPITAFRVFCGIIAGVSVLAFLQELSHTRKKTKAVKNKSESENRKRLTIDLLSRYLPKKHVDAELAYVDVRRVLNENIEMLAKEYSFSSKKFFEIRKHLKEEKRNQKLENIEN